MSVATQLRETVRRRAEYRCEYCRFPEQYAEVRFQLDHVIPEQHGGPSTLENLGWSCPRCNKHKGPNLAGIDFNTGILVPLFHPRQDRWADHFAWNGALLNGLTPTGRVTVLVLQMNRADSVLVRQSLLQEGETFPAPSPPPR